MMRTLQLDSIRRLGLLLFAISSAWLPILVHGQAQRGGTPAINGVVAGTDFVPASGNRPAAAVASHYQRARICADVNNDGACGPREPATTTDDTGAFVLADSDGQRAPCIARTRRPAIAVGHRVSLVH